MIFDIIFAIGSTYIIAAILVNPCEYYSYSIDDKLED